MLEKIGSEENSIISLETEKEIKAFYNELYKKDLEDDDVDQVYIEKKIEGEKSFYKRILNSFDKAKVENPDKVIIPLFDIDETLVKAKIIERGFAHVVRPSAVPLLEDLLKREGSIGFLTSRAQLIEQLDNELNVLKPYIDSRYVFSSREVRVSPFEEEEIENASPENIRYSLVNGDFEKIKLLNEIIKKESNNSVLFMPVDDLKYPSLYPYGVALKDEEKFFI